MDDQQKQALLGVARTVIERCVKGQRPGNFESDDAMLNEKRGCFVTIHNHGDLRGCIGNFQPDTTLLDTVVAMAAAATRDSRFLHHPITPAELNKIDIEISVLSPLEKTDDPLSLELGVHGIYIVRGYAAGCFLPQVATETGWSKEEFLGNCCSHKAGLAAEAWKDSATEVFLFTAEIFGDKEE